MGIIPVVVLAFMLFSPSARTQTGPGQFDGVVDLSGQVVNPFAKDEKVTARVFLFVGIECPISNKYIPEVKRLVKEFESRGVRFWFVYTDPDATPDAIRKHVEDFGFTGEVICDRKHGLVRRSRVEVTPEAAVFSPAGEIVYHGRIDDRFPAFGIERPQPTERTLKTVLTSFLAGERLRMTATKAVGCRIPTAR
jgi:hypothetical protein